MARCPQKQCPLLCPLLFACAANSSALLQAQTQKEGYPWNFDAERRIILSLEVFHSSMWSVFSEGSPALDRWGSPTTEKCRNAQEGESGRGEGGFRVRAAVHVGLDGSGPPDDEKRKRKIGLGSGG